MTTLRPPGIHLNNWRHSPDNRWSFHHVRELIPTARIAADPANPAVLARAASPLTGMSVERPDGGRQLLHDLLQGQWTDALCVMHGEVLVHEWYAPHYGGIEPHILFSVSKSLTGTLAGVLVEQGLLSVHDPVADYIPDAAGSAYADCTLQHVLDMQVGLDFAEVYTGENLQFNRYRAATGWNPPAPGEPPGDLRGFVTTIAHSGAPHGHTFQYASPNTDMLGLILESATGETLGDLLSRHIWKPMGAEADAYVTVDSKGASRSAGGICVLPRDLARFGCMMCNGGRFNGRQIIPQDWVDDCLGAGNRGAWQRGSMSYLLPEGKYRNQWYQTGSATGAFFALGIHGQWIYADPRSEIVIVKMSSQPDPVSDDLDFASIRMFRAIAEEFG